MSPRSKNNPVSSPVVVGRWHFDVQVNDGPQGANLDMFNALYPYTLTLWDVDLYIGGINFVAKGF